MNPIDSIDLYIKALNIDAWKNVVSLAALLAIFALFAWGLIKRDRSQQSRISLDGFLVNPDGTMDKAAAVLFVALLVSSWVVIFQSVKGTLTDVLLLGYLGVWVTPILAKIWKGGDSPPAAG